MGFEKGRGLPSKMHAQRQRSPSQKRLVGTCGEDETIPGALQPGAVQEAWWEEVSVVHSVSQRRCPTPVKNMEQSIRKRF